MQVTAIGMIAASTLLLGSALSATARADVKLNAARVGGSDVPTLARFYESAFGLKEVNRLSFPGNLEIILNFGDSVEDAKANKAAQIVIMHRAAPLKDPVPHLILNVSDINATAAAVQAAGGRMDGKPRAVGNAGVMVDFAIDPAGNRIELLQQPGR